MGSIDLPAGLLGADRWADGLARAWSVLAPRAATLAWATVDLERAEAELRRRLGSTPSGPEVRTSDADPDELLGARARVVSLPGGDRIVLLEPVTEGPLAAGLARHGEGHLGVYVDATRSAPGRLRAASLALSSPARGPLGRQRRVLTGPRDGPFLLLVDGDRGGV